MANLRQTYVPQASVAAGQATAGTVSGEMDDT